MTLSQIRAFALRLPDTTEAPHFDYSSFRVRGKIFVTVPPDGDRIHVFVDELTREHALAAHPGWTEPLHWGKHIVGIRVRLKDAEPGAVKLLVSAAWERKAPKALARAWRES